MNSSHISLILIFFFNFNFILIISHSFFDIYFKNTICEIRCDFEIFGQIVLLLPDFVFFLIVGVYRYFKCLDNKFLIANITIQQTGKNSNSVRKAFLTIKCQFAVLRILDLYLGAAKHYVLAFIDYLEVL